MDPSPTAEATRFTFPERASPTTKTPGRLVSSMCGGRDKDHGIGGVIPSKSRPASTNPFLSRATQPESQSVLGEAPVITKTWRAVNVRISPELRLIHDTQSRWSLPSRLSSSLE